MSERYSRVVLNLTATDAKNSFANLLDTAIHRGPVAITRHGTRKAVLISTDEYERLQRRPVERLDDLSDRFDALLESMQSEASRSALASAFDASPSELLGRAAVKTAQNDR